MFKFHEMISKFNGFPCYILESSDILLDAEDFIEAITYNMGEEFNAMDLILQQHGFMVD